MASKKQTKNTPVQKPQKASIPQPTARQQKKEFKFSIFDFRTQALILAILGFVLYGNTFNHEYAFDDMMAIVDNDYVLEGVSGIPKILSTDAYQSYLEHKNGGNQLAGGRYRPLSLITFAIEQQVLGVYNPDQNTNDPQGTAKQNKEKEEKIVADMHSRHVVNVLLYIGSLIALLYFLSLVVFPDGSLLPFVAAVLFAVHPLHTEVVANVKSRDEILSVLFILLTFIQLYKYLDTNKLKNLVYSLLFYFLALLSKEYAVTLLVLLPLSLFIFRKYDVSVSIKKCLPFLGVFAVYMLMRIAAVSGPVEGAEKNIMNYPYLYATASQKWASEIRVLLDYLKLLFYPAPLIADYSYKQIPYSDFSNPLVWASIVLNAVGLVFSVIFVAKRRVEGFAMCLYFLNLALVANFFFNIGAPMGERLVYHSSLGFCILLATGAGFLTQKLNWDVKQSTYLLAPLCAITLIFGFITINRTADWKNNQTLFLHDVRTGSGSVLINNDAAAACMSLAKESKDSSVRSQYFRQAIGYFNRAIAIHPGYYPAYLNRGLCYFNSGKPEQALPDWDTVRLHEPATQNLQKYLGIAAKYFMSKGSKKMQEGDLPGAIGYFNQAADAMPNAPDIWFNLGLALFNSGDKSRAQKAFSTALQYSPNNPDVLKMLEKCR